MKSLLLFFLFYLVFAVANAQVIDRWTASKQYSITTPPGWSVSTTNYYWAKVTSSNGSTFRSGAIGQSGTWGLTETSATRGNFTAEFGYMTNGAFTPQQWVMGQGYSSGTGAGGLGPPKSGTYDPLGNPVGPGGFPVDGNGNEQMPTTGNYGETGSETNPLDTPATPILTFTPTDPSIPPTSISYPVVEPGQDFDWNYSTNVPGTIDIDWDAGEGIQEGSPPHQLPGTPGATPPTNPGGGGHPGSTPGLTPPASAPAGDVFGAVNRHAALTQMFGEAARSAASFAGNKASEANGYLKGIMEGIEGLGGNGNGNGATEGTLSSIEGDINAIMSTPGIAKPTIPPPADIEALKPSQVSHIDRLRVAVQVITSSFQNSVAALGLGLDRGNSALVLSITLPYFGSVIFDFEQHLGIFLDFMRALMLGMVSVKFVSLCITTLRETLVG